MSLKVHFSPGSQLSSVRSSSRDARDKDGAVFPDLNGALTGTCNRVYDAPANSDWLGK